MVFHNHDYAPDALEVKISELLVATPDASDALIDESVPEVLRLLREHLKMDVIFVSEFVDGRRVFRRVEARTDARVIEAGQSSPLEESFCQRVIDGRLARMVHDVAALATFDELPTTDFPIGAHLSTPIVLNDGRVYGTLCCFSFAPNHELTQRDLRKLELSAQLTAKKINERLAREAEKTMAKWSLQPQTDFSRLR
ncbi:GAF domain-containing protein [Variovorax sp. J22R133]|uniref:GAF domain-containing protein n=1 Tax=Variovorax brevis TaxID=3053503 RepID=UPI002575E728|nr:GAF domain-containing protein [Variovorax sp. J22R133]MDM0110613.1 GAF domain-containing protein [Variovorax sp. J22R133]